MSLLLHLLVNPKANVFDSFEGVFSAIGRGSSYFLEVQSSLNLSDPLVQNSLAVFVAIMVARNAFLLEDFVKHVAIPTLMKVWNGSESKSSFLANNPSL